MPRKKSYTRKPKPKKKASGPSKAQVKKFAQAYYDRNNSDDSE